MIKEVLKNINLKIKSGETVWIIGGTGDRKSSLINLIPRLYDASEGKVLVGGVNVKDYDLKALRNQVANDARKSYEKQTKKSAISKSNALNYKYIENEKLIEDKELKNNK